MKMYLGEKELRLVGKAWEIRHTLRKLSRETGEQRLLAPESGAKSRNRHAGSGASGKLQTYLERR
ncbi:Z-ring formation inhibitor MciZ [Paenibacillus herberti]|nr:Z-ring formation inhibitor MciZ [Paenibacillus herberti]